MSPADAPTVLREDASGSGGRGQGVGPRVSREGDSVDHRGAEVLYQGREQDVPWVGLRCHQHDDSA